ncbi:MAG: EF-hand domain-containing protein [Rhodobacteraceae bacterium]|nr:EF-hand domain-containing protein [Paracoccaceae bacterium]
MNAKTLTAVALLLAAVPAATFAQNAPMRPTPPTLDFATADADGSGGISAEEWTAYASTLRDQMRAQMIGARADALMTAGDANGDGSLTRDELVAGMSTLGDERREARGDGPMGGMRGMMRHHHGEGDGEGRGGWHRRGGDDHERGGMRGDHERGGMRGEGRGDGQGPGPMDGMRGEGRGDGQGPMRGGDRAGMGFARIDANGDGQIDADELAHAQAMMNWMAQRPVRN